VKYFLLFSFLYSSLFAIQTSDKIFRCTKIFEQRKGELLVELERIDEQKQALSALKTATENLLKTKEAKLNQKEEELNAKLEEIKAKENSIKTMLQENKKVLADLKSTKMSKLAQTYAKMKAGAAAGILSDMPPEDALAILRSLKPKVVGKIFTKMDPKKAAKLTELLQK
jgi:flagellar motility protein MotE (MotC chaperone)